MRLSGATLIQPIDRDCPHHRIVDENSFNNHITGTELVLMEYSFLLGILLLMCLQLLFLCMYLFYCHGLLYYIVSYFHNIMVSYRMSIYLLLLKNSCYLSHGNSPFCQMPYTNLEYSTS